VISEEADSRTLPAVKNPDSPLTTEREAGTAEGTACELYGRDALAAWLDAQCSCYAADLRWSAPRRGVALVGRGAVIEYLARELAAMERPRLCQLRHQARPAQTFHEFTIRFRLAGPGIEGVDLPVGAEVELERLRVLTHDAAGDIVVETCIETWTLLPARAEDDDPVA
jgi:hypothetical protein